MYPLPRDPYPCNASTYFWTRAKARARADDTQRTLHKKPHGNVTACPHWLGLRIFKDFSARNLCANNSSNAIPQQPPAWRWRGSARASPEPPLPRALRRTCTARAPTSAAATICCARYGMRDRSSMTCVLVASTCAVCVRCDMLEYRHVRMSCICVSSRYLSGVAGDYLLKPNC